MTGAIWLTEEHVINDFKWVWCKEIELAIIIPHKDNVRLLGYGAHNIL